MSAILNIPREKLLVKSQQIPVNAVVECKTTQPGTPVLLVGTVRGDIRILALAKANGQGQAVVTEIYD